jgi:MFS family permease
MEFTLTFLAVERFAYDERDNAWMFVFVGFLIALVNGGVVRRVVPRLGEKKVAIAGLVVLAPGFLLIGAAGGAAAFYLGLACMAVGSALAMPSLSALVSRYAPPERQGLALGAFRSLGSLSRAIGPVLGGLCYWRLGSAAPYYFGAAFVLLPAALALGLPPVAPEAREEAPQAV